MRRTMIRIKRRRRSLECFNLFKRHGVSVTRLIYHLSDYNRCQMKAWVYIANASFNIHKANAIAPPVNNPDVSKFLLKFFFLAEL